MSMTEKRISFRRNSENLIIELQFWTRFLGFILDNILMKFIIMPVLLIGLSFMFDLLDNRPSQMTESNSYNEIFRTHLGFAILIYLISYGLYTAILESSRLQATFGKLFFRYKVSDLEGNKISFFRAFLRFIFKIISICTLIGAWLIDMTAKRQGLHDIIMKTIVRRR
jgi:uncharacterized RDD family membrane protein YckC